MSAIPQLKVETVRPAHPLFPPHQVFLWLPGLPGENLPYCTYNERLLESKDELAFLLDSDRDENNARYSPPFPVSRQTYIMWHSDTVPPFPYHGVPISRSLSAAEMEKLARRVILMKEEKPSDYPQLLSVLINQNKIYIYLALAEMRMSARFLLSIVP
jgi:hypothetical protein